MVRLAPPIVTAILVLASIAACADPERGRPSRHSDDSASSEPAPAKGCVNACRMMQDKVRAELDSRYLDAFEREMATTLKLELLGADARGDRGFVSDGTEAYYGAPVGTQLAQACLDRCEAGWFSTTCVYTATSKKAVRRCVKPPRTATP